MAVAIERIMEGESFSTQTGSPTGQVVYTAPGVRARDAYQELVNANLTLEHPDDPSLNGLRLAAPLERVGNATDGMGWKFALQFAKRSSGQFTPPPPNFADPDYDNFGISFGTQLETIPLISKSEVAFQQALPGGVFGPPPPEILVTTYDKTELQVPVPFSRVERTVTVPFFGVGDILLIEQQTQKLHALFGGARYYIFTGGRTLHRSDDPPAWTIQYTWERTEARPAIESTGDNMLPVPAVEANGALAIVQEDIPLPEQIGPNTTRPKIKAFPEVNTGAGSDGLRTVGDWTTLPGLS